MNLQLRTNAILEKMNTSFIDLTGEVYTQSPLTGTPNKFIHGLKVIQRETDNLHCLFTTTIQIFNAVSSYPRTVTASATQ